MFIVATDASDFGLGAVLYQKIDLKVKYISFAARALSTSERNYSPTQRECLGIVFALEQFRYYLYGAKFTLFTDHRALTYIHYQKKLKHMLLNWLDILYSFDYDIIHRPGIENVLPDALSRFYERRPPEMEEAILAEIENLKVMIPSSDNTSDDLVPEEQRSSLIKRLHAEGHFGTNAIVKKILGMNKYWPSIRKDIQRVVDECIQCQRHNIGRFGFHPLQHVISQWPLDHISIDLKSFDKSRKKNTYLLVMVDVFTRFVFLVAQPDKEAKTTAQSLHRIFSIVGYPRIVSSDNGKEFINSVLNHVHLLANIEGRPITAYHPQANGLAERMVQTVSQSILKCCNGDTTIWDTFVDSVQYYVNTKVAGTHGSTPYSLLFARHPNSTFLENFPFAADKNLPSDEITQRLQYMTSVVYPVIRKKIGISNAQMSKYFQRRKKMIESSLQPGTMVMALDELRQSKMLPRYTGPFKVVRRNKDGAYLIQGPDGTQYTRPISSLKVAKLSQSFDPHVERGVVSKIMQHRDDGATKSYLVQLERHSSLELGQWERL
ncbi:hypothetical protein MIR68_012621 [Amoeboaphelidium protococcarum]|nr:hypothetical protein MIR68_012621 [Amoeboaphelidium protococcarum]